MKLYQEFFLTTEAWTEIDYKKKNYKNKKHMNLNNILLKSKWVTKLIKGEILKKYGIKWKGRQNYSKGMDATNGVLWEKFTVIKAYFRK